MNDAAGLGVVKGDLNRWCRAVSTTQRAEMLDVACHKPSSIDGAEHSVQCKTWGRL